MAGIVSTLCSFTTNTQGDKASCIIILDSHYSLAAQEKFTIDKEDRKFIQWYTPIEVEWRSAGTGDAVVPPVYPTITFREVNLESCCIVTDDWSHQDALSKQVVVCRRIEIINDLRKIEGS